jgi:REP element-mobilizing transposase RayT
MQPADAPNRTFHVTAHGVGNTDIFRSRADMREYLAKHRNYLSREPYRNAARRPYVKLHDDVSLLAFCLMRNHFHLVIHQRRSDGLASLMDRTQRAYAKSFNNKYNRRGPLFDARYNAKPILDAEHAKHAIAYVHLNEPIQQLDYEFSSHNLMVGESSWDWIDIEASLAIFGGVDAYKAHLDRRGPGLIEAKLNEQGLDPGRSPYRPITRPTVV